MSREKKSACLLVLLISALMLLSACGQAQPAEDPGNSKGVLDYRLADRREGAELMLSNDEYSKEKY